MKEQSKETKKEEQSTERKYAELISYIKILSYRATSQKGEKGEKVGKRLREIATYLEEIRKQRHLCMISENDRIENVRFREILEYVDDKYDEILEYIDSRYDGTENSVKDICKVLNKRKDVNKVLEYHKKEKEKEKEESDR